jgi:hypothetical protein
MPRTTESYTHTHCEGETKRVTKKTKKERNGTKSKTSTATAAAARETNQQSRMNGMCNSCVTERSSLGDIRSHRVLPTRLKSGFMLQKQRTKRTHETNALTTRLASMIGRWVGGGGPRERGSTVCARALQRTREALPLSSHSGFVLAFFAPPTNLPCVARLRQCSWLEWANGTGDLSGVS